MTHRLFALLLLVLGTPALADGKGLASIDATFSGSWYDPAHDGEGLLIEILDADRALGYWFTYDDAGRQLWIVAVGSIAGNRIEFSQALAPRGATFGAGFDPADVELSPWGAFAVEFFSCSTASLEYDGIYGMGGQQLTRLTTIGGLGCEAAASKTLNSSLSAAWYDPRRVGEGFLIEVLSPDRVIVYWFTFDLEGRPLWVVGEGVTDRNRVLVDASVFTRGATFGDAFDPADVERIPFGPMAFVFDGSGNAGAMTFLGPDGFGAGDMELVRLTEVDGLQTGFDGPSFSISGNLAVPGNLVIDGDVNDRNVPLTPNDSADTAQPLPNPVRLAGFSSAAGTANPGDEFAFRADAVDVFRIELAAGQALLLDIGDHDADQPAAVDLDLYLYDIDDTTMPVDDSLSLADRETVVAPATGEYFVLISAFAGASGYTLATGSSDGIAAAGAMSSKTVMMPMEAIVTLRDAGKSGWAKSLLPRGMRLKAGAAAREMLIELAAPKSGMGDRTRKLLRQAGFGVGGESWTTVAAIKQLQADPAVAVAEPNHVYTVQAIPNDEFYGFQWHYPLIGLPQAWDITTGSRDVVVSVIDTGVGAHADNSGNVDFSLGFDFVSRPLDALDQDSIDADADDPGDRSNPDGTGSYHGTHVAGTVGADSANGTGVAGVNWEVGIMPVRVLGRGGSGSGFDIIQGFRWSAGLDNDSGTTPARAADIVNMSLGGTGSSQLMAAAVQEARARGVIVVAAAGNSNSSEPFFPAAYDGVISVAATTITDSKAPYSNFGSTIDIAAPGGDAGVDVDGDGFGDGVLSLLFDDSVSPRASNFVFYNGTSMASPHVAGVAALMKSVYPELAPEELDQAIMSGEITVDLLGDGPTVRNNTFGYGRIDALAAVQWAQARAGGEPVEAILAPSTTMVVFDEFTDRREINLRNAGGGELTITEVSADQPWLTVTADEVDAAGLGNYALVVDRSELPDGLFQASVTVDSSAGSLVIAVSLAVGELAVEGAFGTVYFLLIDPLTGGVMGQTTAADGDDEIVFEQVLPGEYLVIGGTDLDNDLTLCEAGEICSGVPDATDLQIVTVEDMNVSVGTVPLSLPVSIPTTTAAGKTIQRR